MIWVLRAWWARLLGRPLLIDMEGRYVSPDGIAYAIDRTAAEGRLDTVEVRLVADNCEGNVIPGTRLPGLMRYCRMTPLRLEAAIRDLLARADHEMRRSLTVDELIGLQEHDHSVAPQLNIDQVAFIDDLHRRWTEARAQQPMHDPDEMLDGFVDLPEQPIL